MYTSHHSAPVQDLSFPGFSSQIHKLYTCSSDSTLKLWDIPKGGFISDCSTPTSTFTAPYALRSLACNPIAENIIAIRGARDVIVLDSSDMSQLFTIGETTLGTNDLQSLSWSSDGSTLLTLGKDKTLRLFDVRKSQTPTSEVLAHGGNRNSRAISLGFSNYILTCGHTITQDREVAVWDQRNLSTAVSRERIDSSTGTLMPLYDQDTNLLALVGKGDTSTRLYEFDPSAGSLHAISNTPIGEMIKGASLLPKQACNLMSCEVLRILKLTENSVQPVSCTVPRKEKLKFHDDLYPASLWELPPSLTANAWKQGELSAQPTPIALKIPDVATKARPESVSIAPAEASIDDEATAAEARPTSTSSSRPVSMSFGSTVKYKHMFGTEHPKSGQFYNIKPNTSSMDSPLIACSDELWAVPYQGGGGPVYVSKLGENFYYYHLNID